MDGAFITRPHYRHSLDEKGTQIQRVHRKPVANNPILKSSPSKLHKNYAAADTIHPNRIQQVNQQLQQLHQLQQQQQYQRTRRYSQGSYLLKKQKEQQPTRSTPLKDNDIKLRASMSTTTTPTSFWYPRTESQTEPLEPLKRGLSKKLRGLLLPHRTFIERGEVNNEHYIQGYQSSLQRCTSPTTIQPSPFNPRTHKKWDEKEFIQIDNYVSTVQQRGPLLTPSILSQKFLVRPYRKELFRLRALFIWLVHNIRPEYNTRRITTEQQPGKTKKKRLSVVMKPAEETYLDCQKLCAMDLLQEEALDLSKAFPDETAEQVLETRTCMSSFGMAHLFVVMAQAAGFQDAKVVYGYLKAPKDTVMMAEHKLPLNHAWCSVKIEDEYRLIDCWLASPYHPQNENKVESHWFLSTPSDMILTHLPKHPQQQYLNPPLSCTEFFELPYVRHAFFAYPMRVLNYQIQVQENGLFYMSFQVKDKDIGCFAETESEQDGTLLRGLAQCTIDDHDRRVFKVKGVLPPNQSSGWLKVYLGPKLKQQQQQYEDEEQQEQQEVNHYPLSMCIYIQQEPSVEDEQFEFVKIYVDHNEFYINEPQCYQLYPLQTYRFCIKANRLDYYYNRSTHYKLAVKSPSGKLFKLMYYPQDQTYDGNVTTSEAGKWSLVCLLHNTGGSYTVASWTCKLNK